MSDLQELNPIENCFANDAWANESTLVQQLTAENAKLTQDLADAQDRLTHVEPVFALALKMFEVPNPYTQGQLQAEIVAYFRKHKYEDWYAKNGIA